MVLTTVKNTTTHSDNEGEVSTTQEFSKEQGLSSIRRQVLGALIKLCKEDDNGDSFPLWENVMNELGINSRTNSQHNQFYKLLSSTNLVLVDENIRPTIDFVQRLNGTICNMDDVFLRDMLKCVPSNLGAALVGDFNDNLAYAMEDRCGLRHLMPDCQVLDEFESKLQTAVGSSCIEYRGSFMKTENTIPQPPHVDYNWDTLDEKSQQLYIGFFPLTLDGMYIQVWEPASSDSGSTQAASLVYIPFGKLLILPSDTIHGGGFKTSCANGNLRFHLYIAAETDLPKHMNNRYTERFDKRKELGDRYFDAENMDQMVDHFFEQ